MPRPTLCAMAKGRRVPSLMEGRNSSYISTAADGAICLSSFSDSVTSKPVVMTAIEAPAQQRKSKKRADTAGSAWGNMAAPELTTELKRELLVVKMRGALDPKRFYRSSDHKKGLPKYFQARDTLRHARAEAILSCRSLIPTARSGWHRHRRR